MENAIYTNRYGDRLVEKVDSFDIRGTIMTASIKKIMNNFVHRLYIEDGKGGYGVTIWDSCIGYNREALKAGRAVRVKGIVHHNWIEGRDGEPIDAKNYSAYEMSLV